MRSVVRFGKTYVGRSNRYLTAYLRDVMAIVDADSFEILFLLFKNGEIGVREKTIV